MLGSGRGGPISTIFIGKFFSFMLIIFPVFFFFFFSKSFIVQESSLS